MLTLRSPLATGLAAGRWCPYGLAADEPADQREDDGKSLLFDTGPLPEPIEIMGAAVVTLEVAADRPNAMVAVRLNDVAPDGSSLRVTYGLLNLTHRDGHEQPEPLEPGRFYRVRVRLNDIAHHFRAGHRVRLAVSTTYWPIAWPSPEGFTLSLRTGASRLDLPVRPPVAEDAALPPFAEPEAAAKQVTTVLRPGGIDVAWTRDVASGETVLTAVEDDGAYRIDAHGLEHESVRRIEKRIGEDDPGTAAMTKSYSIKMGRGGWAVRTETSTSLRATPTEFLIDANLEAYEGERLVLSRVWRRRVPRDLV